MSRAKNNPLRIMSLESTLGSLHEPLTGRHFEADECRRLARQVAARLADYGLRPGDRVFVHSGNDAEFFIQLLGIWLAGCCVVPVDPRLTVYEIARLASAVRPAISIWDRDPEPSVTAALAEQGVPAVERTSLMTAARHEVPTRPVRDDDDALMLFTSGTTGDPKAVIHTHRSLQRRWQLQREHLGTSHLSRTLFMLPGNFAWGLAGNALYVWFTGADLHVLPAFRTDVLLQLGILCDEHRITYLPTVPTMRRMVLRTVAPPARGTLARIACGTSPLPASLWLDIRKWSGAREILNVYSMTECGMLATHDITAGTPEDGLVGAPFAGVEIRIVPLGSPHASLLAAGECLRNEVGVIWAKTPTLMRGYFGRDDLTAEVVTDGWFRTGDVGMLDGRGQLYLRGRDKEMINVGGVKVYPLDVDVVMARCEAVQDVCTFGVDDPVQGEQVAIAVVLKPPHERHIGQLHGWAEKHLAAFQTPRHWYVVDDIPRNARGKLNRDSVAAACAGKPALDLRAIAAAAANGIAGNDAG